MLQGVIVCDAHYNFYIVIYHSSTHVQIADFPAQALLMAYGE